MHKNRQNINYSYLRGKAQLNKKYVTYIKITRTFLAENIQAAVQLPEDNDIYASSNCANVFNKDNNTTEDIFATRSLPYNDPKLLFPIPARELEANPKLKSQQNPGY